MEECFAIVFDEKYSEERNMRTSLETRVTGICKIIFSGTPIKFISYNDLASYLSETKKEIIVLILIGEFDIYDLKDKDKRIHVDNHFHHFIDFFYHRTEAIYELGKTGISKDFLLSLERQSLIIDHQFGNFSEMQFLSEIHPANKER